MRKNIVQVGIIWTLLCGSIHAQTEYVPEKVNVRLSADESFLREGGKPMMDKIERNISVVLGRINAAYRNQMEVDFNGLPMNSFAREGLVELCKHVKIYCDGDVMGEDGSGIRLWNFSSGYMVRTIPIIMLPNYGSDTTVFQNVVMEFDRNGTVTDFRISSDKEVDMCLEYGGDSVDQERKIQILAYCDRFRTAYCNKDIAFLRQVFSEDALIITGNVIRLQHSDMAPRESIRYSKQSRDQYLANLEKCFKRNEWISVKFSEIGQQGKSCGEMTVTRSTEHRDIYGVRLRQEWSSPSYHDVGYIFLLWDFTNEDKPIIHVRTWQPEKLNGKILEDVDIFSLDDFETKIAK